MKKLLNISKKENVYKKIKNAKEYPKIKNSNDSNNPIKNIPTIEKQKFNISEDSKLKENKKINNTPTEYKTFNSRNIPLNNNKISYFNLYSINKRKHFLESLNKIKNKIKLSQSNIFSEKTMEKSMNNNSMVKISDYSIYLQNEILDLSNFKKYINVPKSRDFLNNKFQKLKKISFPHNKTHKNSFLKSSCDINIITNNKNKNFIECSGYVNIYNPQKLLRYNKKNKNEDCPPKIMKNVSEENIRIKINDKIKENISIDFKDESIIKEKEINKGTLELNLTQRIKNTNKNDFKSMTMNIFAKDLVKKDNKNKLITQKNLNKTIAKKKNNEHQKEIENKSPSKEEIPEFVRTITPYNIENGGIIDNNKRSYNNSTNTLILAQEKQKKIKEEIIIIKNTLRSVKDIKVFSLNQNPIFNKKKIKYLNIIPIKESNINNEHKKFLDKIKDINDYERKLSFQNMNIKKNKRLLLNKQKNIIDDIKIDSKNDLQINSSSYELNNIQELENYKNCNYIKRNDKNNNLKSIYDELKYLSIMFILFYGYISHINKCTLDENTINYLLLNNSLSTLYVPLVNITKKRSPLFMKGKLLIIKNINYFEDKKSKFIELQRSKQIFESTYSHFIYKEFSSLISDNKNIIKDYKDNKKKNNNNTKKFQRRQIKSYTRMQKEIKIKNLFRHQSLNSQKISNFNKTNIFYKYQKKVDNLSILQKGKIFENSQKHKNINIKRIKRISNLVNGNYYRRSSIRNSLSYYDLIETIKGKDKSMVVLKNLLKEREIYLFIEYANSNSRKIDLNKQDEDGNTFLILSIKNGLDKLTKFLLEKKINVNIQNKEGNTALHYALSGKNFLMADLLRKYGALENVVNKLGYTPWDSIGKSIEYDSLY